VDLIFGRADTMTDAEWLACIDPEPLLHFLVGRFSERKLLLLKIACCHRISHLLPDRRSKNALVAAEQHAEGHVGQQDMLAAARGARQALEKLRRTIARTSTSSIFASDAAANLLSHPPSGTVAFVARAAANAVSVTLFPGEIHDETRRTVEKIAQVALFRDIAGNPFRPMIIAPARLSSSVVRIARSIYDDRRFENMPILADALEDAGCHDTDILNHCRQPGEHVRGCWVVDLLLGKW
jgi:hypothetical protein